MGNRFGRDVVRIDRLEVSAYTVPTDFPESDGTYAWKHTTLVLAEATAGGKTGLGYSYADTATAALIRDSLAEVVRGRDAMAVPGAWSAMVAAIRNLGRPGIASMAISAVDSALWDLKARLLDMPLVTLLGAVRDAAPVYGSGGFTSYSLERLRDQLGGWATREIRSVKMKIGTHPADDLDRVRAARDAIGPDVELFVDANGAYSRKQALAQAEAFAALGVCWFEEPVTSDDLEGLRLLRDRAPAGMEIAAGEYGYDLFYFRRMLDAGAVDVLQADSARCAGYTEWLRVAAVAMAFHVPFSAHCGPALHAPVAAVAPTLRHIEWFHDHVRIERMLLDGVPELHGGCIRLSDRPGHGMRLKDEARARLRRVDAPR
ncbi:MAG: hypothetical protein JO329_25435 [Planctomycetaceae bacterium]|nr:hypothetical protein [Planctomycetaceae bacterium]